MVWFMWALCSALLSAVSAVLQKKILFRFPALEFSFSVSLCIALFSFVIPFSTDVISLPLSTMVIIIGKSILGASAFLLVMLSLEHNQISSALPLLGVTPAAAAIVSFVVLGEGLMPMEWIGVGLMIAGAYLMEGNASHNLFTPIDSMIRSKHYYYIYGAVGLFALSSVVDKLLVGGMKVDPFAVLFYQHFVYVLFFFVMLSIRRIPLIDVLHRSADLVPLILIVAVFTIAYRFTQLEAMKLAPVALVLAVKRTSIIFASFFGGKLFSDERLGMKLLGAVLIVAAGFIILRNV
jgi:uncharacterized membrane protein